MFKLTLLTTGKTKEPWLQGAVEEYTKRLKSAIELTWRLAKDDKQLEEWTLLEPHFLGLDPNGKLLHSKEWSSFLFDIWERQGCRLTMVIGGACGLTEPMKKKATALISLSPLTFTHQLTRVILLEQIYRALEIRRDSPYHR